MCIADGEGRWIRVTDVFCERLGYEREDPLRTTFLAITHPEDRAADRQRQPLEFMAEVIDITERRQRVAGQAQVQPPTPLSRTATAGAAATMATSAPPTATTTELAIQRTTCRSAPTPGWPPSTSWRSTAPRSRPSPAATAHWICCAHVVRSSPWPWRLVAERMSHRTGLEYHRLAATDSALG
jgi:hypothetical protein